VERLWRWSRRHRLVAGLTAALVLVVAAAFAGVTWQWRIAQANYAQAEENLDQARLALSQLTMYSTIELRTKSGVQPIRRKMLSDALESLRQLTRHSREDPRVLKTLASTYYNLAIVSSESGRLQEAAAGFRQAESLYLQFLHERPENIDGRRQLAGVYFYLGWLQRTTGQMDEALRSHQKARETWEYLAREDPAIHAGIPGVKSHSHLRNVALNDWATANVYLDLGRLPEARRRYLDARKIQEHLVAENPADEDPVEQIAYSDDSMGLLLLNRKFFSVKVTSRSA
jgi:tetratricopeptide (TPR) repeat protein